ncbi:MAG: peptidase M61, partial [Stenotrophomonas maltophilia]
MKTRALAMSLLFALAATPALALAQAAPPANAAAPGLLRIDVDARDLARRIFKVTATVPAKPGPMTLLY